MKVKALNILFCILLNSPKWQKKEKRTMIEQIIGASIAAISLLGMLLTLRRVENRLQRYDGAVDSVTEFFQVDVDEKGQIQCSRKLGLMLSGVGQSIAKSIKMSFLGELSGKARLDKGLKTAIAQDVIDEKMPVLNLVSEFLGENTKKWITKHPEGVLQLMNFAAPMLQKAMQNNGRASTGGYPSMS